MGIIINWKNTGTIIQDDICKIEEHIKTEAPIFIENNTPCHEGAITITINIENPISNILIGNMKCSCGRAFGLINGSTSSLSFETTNA